jgi:hypothetical protein
MGNIYNKMGKQSDNISSENFVCTKIIRKRGDNFFFSIDHSVRCVARPGGGPVHVHSSRTPPPNQKHNGCHFQTRET